jgi:hypothetical protein
MQAFADDEVCRAIDRISLSSLPEKDVRASITRTLPAWRRAGLTWRMPP